MSKLLSKTRLKDIEKGTPLICDTHVYVAKNPPSNDGSGNTRPMPVRIFALFEQVINGGVKIMVIRDDRPNSSFPSELREIPEDRLGEWRVAGRLCRMFNDFTRPSNMVTHQSGSSGSVLETRTGITSSIDASPGTIKRRPLVPNPGLKASQPPSKIG